MPIEIRTALERDLKRCAEIGHVAFGKCAFNKIMFPGYEPKDGFLGLRTTDLVRQLRDDPTVRMFVAIDTERRSGCEIVGFAKWHVYQNGMPSSKTKLHSWGSSCNVEACNLVFGGVGEMRDRLIQGRPCIYLHILVTEPQYQHRGVGQNLLAFGIQESLRLELPAYLEATEAGHSLYQKAGFDDVEVHRADLTKFGGHRPCMTWGMIREPYSWFP
ncbi:acetyltransferase [Colletotrichum orchidophilum]|uniref:Acetyltransferase n=1 Tax=Colletotrichum orchidophilum TaxID=1209926 RepID=A0A1G4ARG0_9PEZI|nr:acetyltransferase [Colletotrichum orchidophilum]OHE91696.1 acetyltransferase [Colletotrichum orchidophilum]